MNIYKIKYIQDNSLKFIFIKANSKDEAQKKLLKKNEDIFNDNIISINDIKSKDNTTKIDFDFSKVVNLVKSNKKPISIALIALLLIIGGKFAYDSYKNSQYESYSEGDFEAQEDYESSHKTEPKTPINNFFKNDSSNDLTNNSVELDNNLFTYSDLQEVVVQGNVKRGKKKINVCISCHGIKSQGINKPFDNIVSMNTWGVDIPDLSNTGVIYDEKFLLYFLQDPAKVTYLKKHSMPPSVGNVQDAADIIAYLKSIAPKEVSNKEAFESACGRCHAVKYDNWTQIGTYPYNKNELIKFNKNLKAYQKKLVEYLGKLPPDLSTIVKEKSSDYLEKFVDNPQKQFLGTTMPRIGLTKESYMKIKSYLDKIGNKNFKQKNNNSNQYNTFDKPINDDNSNRVALANNLIEPNSNSLKSGSVEKFSNNQISLNINWKQESNWISISVSAKNLYANAKGGISVSFPDLEYSNRVKLGFKNGVNSFKAYPKGSKIWSKSLNSAISSKYLLVEGWDNHWKKGDTNSINFKVNVKDLKVLRFNVRSVLLKNRQEYILPQNGDIDQQGYPTKQISIELGNNTNSKNNNSFDNYKFDFKNSYIAKISNRDHYNSRGKRLTKVIDILRQDRANYSKYTRDDEDTYFDYFSILSARNEMSRYAIKAVGISYDRLKNLIINSNPVLKIEVRNKTLYVSLADKIFLKNYFLTKEEKISLLKQILNRKHIKKDPLTNGDTIIKPAIRNYLANVKVKDGITYTYENSCKKIYLNEYKCYFQEATDDGEDESAIDIYYKAIRKNNKIIFDKIEKYFLTD